MASGVGSIEWAWRHQRRGIISVWHGMSSSSGISEKPGNGNINNRQQLLYVMAIMRWQQQAAYVSIKRIMKINHRRVKHQQYREKSKGGGAGKAITKRRKRNSVSLKRAGGSSNNAAAK